MDELIRMIEKRIEILEPQEQENEKMIADDFDPDSWSGGNFDDCYFMGARDGAISGELHALYNVLGELKKLEGMM
ncbi:hypothetical protein PQE70_gp163 [Bacillus phage vB_BanS_Nate]|uniref:Uncharacterized protein n=1 Tax=Bacillus phage vB_BanS_Nate TaxID=2894788 RepID=A0AAE9CEF1_9CAUD|nr:hypothetical protein PQE70_gp163 [Bacillus phage vB_BanS_Nate]UGO51016.1 hypothetical protein NATE_163 [Bacillus phage vB_BanS_Nate]